MAFLKEFAPRILIVIGARTKALLHQGGATRKEADKANLTGCVDERNWGSFRFTQYPAGTSFCSAEEFSPLPDSGFLVGWGGVGRETNIEGGDPLSLSGEGIKSREVLGDPS